MTFQVFYTSVEGLDHSSSACGALVLACALVRSPSPLRQAGACLGCSACQFIVPGDLGGVVLFPHEAFSSAAFNPALVAARVGSRHAISGRVEIQEGSRHITQQSAVVTDQSQATGVITQSFG